MKLFSAQNIEASRKIDSNEVLHQYAQELTVDEAKQILTDYGYSVTYSQNGLWSVPRFGSCTNEQLKSTAIFVKQGNS